MLPREIATDVPPEDNVKCLLLPNKSVNSHRAQYISICLYMYMYVCVLLLVMSKFTNKPSKRDEKKHCLSLCFEFRFNWAPINRQSKITSTLAAFFVCQRII